VMEKYCLSAGDEVRVRIQMQELRYSDTIASETVAVNLKLTPLSTGENLTV
jgi:hypothetical protein